MNYIDLESIVVPNVKTLQAYQPGKPLDELEREFGISKAIKLASNENPLGPGPLVLDAIHKNLADLSRYPDDSGYTLKSKLSKYLDVAVDKITLGSGTTDILEMIVRTFVNSGDEVIISQYAFILYSMLTRAADARAIITPAKCWGVDLDAMLASITERTKVIFIANPNNPTGTWLTTQQLESFLGQVPPRVLVVLDEAYFEFAADAEYGVKDYPNSLQWLNSYPNLIITRTFSKAHGIAGLRVGYALSHPDVAGYLRRIQKPFAINSLALAAATAALDDVLYLKKTIQLNALGKQYFERSFAKMKLSYIPSAGNFISVEVGDAESVYQLLMRQGVIVRPVANYEMPEFLRISIGTEEENRRCVSSLNSILYKAA